MPGKILFVDDDPNFQKMVEIFLRNNSYDISFAKNGRSALHLIQQHVYDLVISDVQMPEMDGLTMITEIKKVNADLPVIIVSAFGNESMAEKAIAAGARLILNKPFESKALISAIETFIR